MLHRPLSPPHRRPLALHLSLGFYGSIEFAYTHTYLYTSTSWLLHVLLIAVIGCPYLDPPANGKVELSGMIVDSIATFTCDPGFELIGKTLTRVCQSDGRWSGISPQCRPGR